MEGIPAALLIQAHRAQKRSDAKGGGSTLAFAALAPGQNREYPGRHHSIITVWVKQS
jgi:hypothetical protein